MGIEGGSSNREVQSQEIQQANSEQNELNQADHKRSGEELEANSTIDNEGERKQIEGREEATDSKDGNVSRLDDAETIEDERQGSEIENEERSYSIQDNLDDLGTIEEDTESFDDPNEDEAELEDDSFEDVFITDEDEFIEDAQDDKHNDDNDGDFSDRIEDDNSITETEEFSEIHEDYETIDDDEGTDDLEDSEEENVEDEVETENSAEDVESDEKGESTEDTDDVEASEEEATEDMAETEDSAKNVESDEIVEDAEETDDLEDFEEETVEDTPETEDSTEEGESDETVEDTEDADDVEDSEEETVEDVAETDDTAEDVEADETVEDTEDTDGVEDFKEETAEDTTETEKTSDASDSSDAEKRPEKFEDLSWNDINELMKTPEGREVLNNMNADFRERYEADMRGMSVEEYRDYKAALARADYERKKENGEIAPRNLSDAERNANAVLEAFNYQDDKSSQAYMSGAKMQDLKDISDKNHELIKELKGVRQDIEAEHDKVWDKIASMNYDGSRDYNPGEYEELCEQYRHLESLGKQLDYAIVKTDMNNWDISQVTGLEYKDESKRLTEKEISSTLKNADSILKYGVTDNASIMDAYRVGEKLEHDVLPSLDGERRELESRLNVYENTQMNYRKEHFCTHEEAMKTSDGIYAQNERDIQKIKEEIEVVSRRMTDAVEKATALHDQVPVAGSDCKLKVIDNKDGTITIERTWDNGEADKKSYEGRIHNAETIRYNNAREKKDSITLGQNSGLVYSHSFSFQYRGLGFKREDTWGSGDKKLKSVAEGGFLNFNASFGYKRGIEGEKSTIKADAGGSLAQFKETASLVVKDKEYKGFAAEVSLLKESSSISVDSKGIVKASASAHIAGGEAAISAGGVNIAKISGGIGEVKASLSTSLLDEGASASIGEYKSSVSVWSVLKSEDSSTESDDKQLIEAKGSASVGNEFSLVSSKISSTDGEVKNTTVVDTLKKDVTDFVDGIKAGSININSDTVSGIVKDVKAIRDIKEENLENDISHKPEDIVIGNSNLKEKPEDFESKIVDHSVPENESHENIDLGEDLKRSLEPFNQSKWDIMSFDERKEAVAKLANSVAKDLGLENQPDVKYYQSDEPGDFGGFSASENSIYINANNMDDAVETADTIAHESRHCWQHEYAEKSDSALAQEFRENFEDYVRPEDDYRGYKNQPVEKDARDYASGVTSIIDVSEKSSGLQSVAVDTSNASADAIRERSEEKGTVFNGEDTIPNDIESKTEEFESKLKRPEDYSSSFGYSEQCTLEKYYRADGGKLSDENAKLLTDELKTTYDTASDTKDVLVPENSKDVTGIRYDEFNKRYEVTYDWKDVDTVPETRTMKVLKEGQQFDRVGYPSGRCVGEVNSDGSCATGKQRSIPYHLTKENITDEPSYHRYEALQDFTRENIEKAIDGSYVSEAEKAFMHKRVEDYYNTKHEKYGEGDGLAYGEIAPMFEDTTGSTGGGYQYDMPLSMEQLAEIGMIDEIPKSEFK